MAARNDDLREVALALVAISALAALAALQLPRFTQNVVAAFADVLKRQGDSVCFRNTCGDGVYVVLVDAVSAAPCALDLQQAMAAIDLEAHTLRSRLRTRLSGHFGPIFPVRVPILEADVFMGHTSADGAHRAREAGGGRAV